MDDKKYHEPEVTPPSWADRFLEWYCASELLDEIQGDLHEAFYIRVEKYGHRKAKLLFIKEVLLFCKPSSFEKPSTFNLLTAPVMFQSYFIIAFRTLRKYPSFTIINVIGLALGITCCLLIFLLLRNELSFDRFLTKGEQMYRVVSTFENENGTDFNANTPYPLAPAMRADFLELENVTQIHYSYGELITVGQDRYDESNIVYADSLFLEVFDYDWMSGDPQMLFRSPIQ